MRIRLLSAMVLLVGCAESSGPVASESEFVSRGGATLTSPDDAGLRISLTMVDGVKPRTKNQRFIKATVHRDSKSFGAFCELHGAVDTTAKEAVIRCSLGATTVSNDDDESLTFDVALSGEALTLENITYFGDGTFLGEQAAVLGDKSVALAAKETANAEKNPLAFARLLIDGASSLVGQRVHSEEVDAEVAVSTVRFGIDKKLDLSTSLGLGRTGVLSIELPSQSVLETPGDLSKGLLDAPGLSTRLKAALP